MHEHGVFWCHDDELFVMSWPDFAWHGSQGHKLTWSQSFCGPQYRPWRLPDDDTLEV